MNDEKRMSLREAGRAFGVTRRTLRKWLEDSGLQFPVVPRGSKFMVGRGDVERAVSRHAPRG